MTQMTQSVSYRRKGGDGILTLAGAVDIFEAAGLHALAVKALHDKRARNVRVDLSGVERVDLSAAQILKSLRLSIESEGERGFEAVATPENVQKKWDQVGFAL